MDSNAAQLHSHVWRVWVYADGSYRWERLPEAYPSLPRAFRAGVALQLDLDAWHIRPCDDPARIYWPDELVSPVFLQRPQILWDGVRRWPVEQVYVAVPATPEPAGWQPSSEGVLYGFDAAKHPRTVPEQ